MKRHKLIRITPSISRLAGLTLATALTLGLAVTSAAFAESEFKPTGGAFNGSSNTANIFKAGTNSITCTGNTTTGTVASAFLVDRILVDFTGCKSTGSGGSNCTVKSIGGREGLILTNTLHGVLGLVLPKGSGSGVGLLLLPVANKKFVEIESTKCSPSTTVLGNVAGEVTPVHVSQNTASLKFQPSGQGGTQGESIKEFDFSTGGLVVPELEAFGLLASQKTEEALVYSEAVEVT